MAPYLVHDPCQWSASPSSWYIGFSVTHRPERCLEMCSRARRGCPRMRTGEAGAMLITRIDNTGGTGDRARLCSPIRPAKPVCLGPRLTLPTRVPPGRRPAPEWSLNYKMVTGAASQCTRFFGRRIARCDTLRHQAMPKVNRHAHTGDLLRTSIATQVGQEACKRGRGCRELITSLKLDRTYRNPEHIDFLGSHSLRLDRNENAIHLWADWSNALRKKLRSLEND